MRVSSFIALAVLGIVAAGAAVIHLTRSGDAASAGGVSQTAAASGPAAGQATALPASNPPAERRGASSSAPQAAAPVGGVEERVAALEAEVASLQKSLRAGGNDPRRLTALEQSVKLLQSAMDGVSLEKASADRNVLFAGEEGYLKADEYFAAGKFAIAGEGYLTFFQNHPQHPDSREVLKKARDSFLKAGYNDKAFWVQEEMMKGFPQHQLADLEELATLEKNAGRYDRAVEHMAQAAQLDPHPEQRLWKRLYWAWYVQLRDGSAAGLAAMQQVHQEVANSGVTNPLLHERTQQKLLEFQQQLAREQQKR